MQVTEYLATPKNIRQKHLDLASPCQERGGTSQHHKGVLAHFLDSRIYGRPADLCHACHNPKCSNPRHLYWGTRSENMLDARANGGKTPWQRTVLKYGEDNARRISSDNSRQRWNSNNLSHE